MSELTHLGDDGRELIRRRVPTPNYLPSKRRFVRISTLVRLTTWFPAGIPRTVKHPR